MNKINALKEQGFNFDFCDGGFYISLPGFSKQVLDQNSEVSKIKFSLWQYYTDEKNTNGIFSNMYVHMPFSPYMDRILWNADNLESYAVNLIKFKDFLKDPPSLTKQEAMKIRDNIVTNNIEKL